MKLLHYGTAPLERVHDTDNSPDFDGNPYRNDKPLGLWVSVVDRDGHDGWREFCEHRGGMWLEQYKHPTEVILRDDANILWIKTPAELHAFSAKYSNGSVSRLERGLRWPDIAREYDGIVIAPYMGACRFDLDCYWYWGWDCASGCIWNSRAILDLKPVERAEAPSQIS